jgi:hypothetical protein
MAALPTAEVLGAALLWANDAYLAPGCGRVHDVGGLVGPAFGSCQDLFGAGRLALWICAFAASNSLHHPMMGVLGAGMRTGLGDKRLRLGAGKVMTDGSSSGPTAATREPYTSTAQDCAILIDCPFTSFEGGSKLALEHLCHRPCGVRQTGEVLQGIFTPDTDGEVTGIGKPWITTSRTTAASGKGYPVRAWTSTRGASIPGPIGYDRGSTSLQGGQGYEVVSLSGRAKD